MDSRFRLDGQRAVVTGGNRGIGAGISLELARAGADVISVHRSEAAEVAEAVRKLGRHFDSVPFDLVAADGIPGLVEGLLARFGPVDILVHNAGLQRRHPAHLFPVDEWDDVLTVHLKAAFLLAQGFGRPMLERGQGKIVFISSLLSFQGGVTVPAYAAAKAGEANLARSLANEWAAKGVNVNSVAPGYVDTELNTALINDPVRSRQIGERIPAGRWGKPEDIAPAVRFLCSDAARYVHGHALVVDGGWLGR